MEKGTGVLHGHFQFKVLPDGALNRAKVLCSHCNAEFSYHRSTSSLKYHLNAKHSVDTSKPFNGTKSGSRIRRTSRLDTACGRILGEQRQKKLTNAIAKLIATSCRPVGVEEDDGLRNVLRIATNAAEFAVLDSVSENTLKESQSPLTTPNQNYISDAAVPAGEPWLEGGPLRAALSLPFCLNLCLEPEPSDVSPPGSSSKEWVVEMGVHAKFHLQEGLVFGPFVGELVRGAPQTSLTNAWIIREDSEFHYVDATDENKSNWMRYVSYATKEEDHNLIVIQLNQQIYYRTSKPISEGGVLKVRIGEDYAGTLCLDSGDTRCDFGKKESILGLYLDVQLVTLDEPSSSLWFNDSQSQDAMPIIQKVTSTSTPDSAVDSGPASGSSQAYLHEEHYFFPGSDNLLNHPTQAHSRLWYFYGFKSDPTGQPIDWSMAVCKLCGEQVASVDTVSHLNNKHEISSHRFIRGQRIQNPLISGQKSKALAPVLSGSPEWASTPPLLPQSTDRLTNAVCNFLIRDLYQPAMVEGQGFKELIQTLLPSYKELPSAGILEALLKDLHTKEKKRLRQLLGCKTVSQEEEENAFDYTPQSETNETFRHPTDLSHLVTLSVDVWQHVWQGETSRNATLWVHYIDANFDSQNWALTTQRLVETETEDVEAQVKMMALEWGISHSHLVLLGGDTVEKGSSGLRRRNQSGEPEGRNPAPSPHIPCFFTAVQGCIEEVMSFPVISETLRMFQDVLSGLFTLCPKINPFRSQIEPLLLKIALGERAHLQSWAHSPLSWKSLFTVINILNKHKKLVSDLIKLETGTVIKQEDSAEEDFNAGGVAVPGESEWKVLQELSSVLKPMDVACRTLAKEAFPRLSLIKPILIGLLTRHLVSQPNDVMPVTKGVKMRMKERLAGCYENPVVNRILCVACSLDPQFRHLGFMEAKDQTTTHDWLKEEAVKMMKEDQRGSMAGKRRGIKRSSSFSSSDTYDNQPRRSKRIKNAPPISFIGCDDVEDEDSDAEEAGEKEPAEADSQGGLSGMQFLLGDLLGSTAGGTAALAEEDAVDIELSLFTADKRPSLGVEPLEWWKSKTGQFPLLAAVARAYLAAPAVAGSAALDFSTEGAINKKRRNIPPESLAEMLFLHHNHMTTPTD